MEEIKFGVRPLTQSHYTQATSVTISLSGSLEMSASNEWRK